MTLEHFDLLSKSEQQELLLNQGTFLAERQDGPFRVMLYQLESFYVEVYFFSRYNKVAFFLGFDSTESLQPYLQEININDLLQEVLS